MPKNENRGWPPEGLEYLDHCPVCGNKGRQAMFGDLVDNTFFCAPGTWQLWRCLTCSSAYLDPRPSPESIHLAYQSYYTHTAEGNRAPENRSGLKLLQHKLANGYQNSRYGTRLAPAYNYLGTLLSVLFPKRRRYWDSKYRFLPKAAPGMRLLDVGFGSGDFLELASSIGWGVTGVDFDPVAVTNARARGFDVYEGGIDTLKDKSEHFDAITMSHVIEHVHDPVSALDTACRLLKPDGLLFLETPNINSMGLRLYGPCWRGLEAPRHLTLFTWKALKETLTGVGFTTINSIYKPEVSKNMFRLSKAIQMGDREPAGKIRLSLAEKMSTFLPVVARQRSEFITVTARKGSARY